MMFLSFSTQASVHTSATSATRPSPSAALWSPTWRRSTASPWSTPTRSDATSCTCARSAATRQQLRMRCSSISTHFTLTAPCWRARPREEWEEETAGRSEDPFPVLRRELKAMIPLDRPSSKGRRYRRYSEINSGGIDEGLCWVQRWLFEPRCIAMGERKLLIALYRCAYLRLCVCVCLDLGIYCK